MKKHFFRTDLDHTAGFFGEEYTPAGELTANSPIDPRCCVLSVFWDRTIGLTTNDPYVFNKASDVVEVTVEFGKVRMDGNDAYPIIIFESSDAVVHGADAVELFEIYLNKEEAFSHVAA